MSRFGASLEELSRRQKTAKGVSLYSRYVNRPVGRVLAAAAHVAGWTPNQVTALSAVLTLLGLLVMASVEPSPPVSVLVWSLLAAGFALDSADGQLARLRGGGSPVGEWLDHATDSVKVVAVHVAVLVMLYRFDNPLGDVALLAALLFAIVSAAMFTSGLLTELLRREARVPRQGADAAPSRTRAVGLLPADYGVLCTSFLLTWWPLAFGVVYVVLALLNLVLLSALWVKWFRETSRLAAASPGASSAAHETRGVVR